MKKARWIEPYKGEIEYPMPIEGQFLKIKLDPDGLHDLIDPYELGGSKEMTDKAVAYWLGVLRRQNLAKGFKDGFKPTFSIVQWRKSKAAVTNK